MKVTNVISPSSGCAVRNQFLIRDEENSIMYFQSYESVILKIDRANLWLTFGADWDYSATTRRWLYHVLREECCIGNDISNKIIQTAINSNGKIGRWNVSYSETL